MLDIYLAERWDRHNDLLREAQHRHLIHEALGARSQGLGIRARAILALANWLVVSGRRLQARYEEAQPGGTAAATTIRPVVLASSMAGAGCSDAAPAREQAA